MPYGQNLTIHLLSGQTLGVDANCGFFPRMSGGGYAALVGTLAQVCTIPVNTATVTAQVRGGPGTRWQVSSMCGGAAAKMWLQDVTQNTWADIDSIGGGVATVSQPLSNSLLTTIGIPAVAESSMATNDAFAVWSQPLVNLKGFQAESGDVSSGGQVGATWIQDIRIADSSGAGTSEFPLIADGLTVLSRVRLDTRLNASSLHGRGLSMYVLGSDLGQGVLLLGGEPAIYGGVARSTVSSINGVPTLAGDVAVHGTMSFYAGVPIFGTSSDQTGTYSDSNIIVEESATLRLNAPLWGTVSIALAPNAWVRSNSLAFNNTLLTNGALQLVGPLGVTTTGTSYAAGVWTDGINLTVANLVANGGLQNPVTHNGFSQD
jgi:hypothetical protein